MEADSHFPSGVTPFEHTADIGFEVTGRSKEELFETAALGMAAVITGANPRKIDNGFELNIKEMEVEGEEDEDILVGFLSELLFLFDTEHFIPTGFSGSKTSPGSFSTRAKGLIIPPDEYEFYAEIKAVTYEEMDVHKDAGGWKTRVIFDV